MRYKARLIIRREKIPVFKWVIASLIPCNAAIVIQVRSCNRVTRRDHDSIGPSAAA
jgi:hypothetical protein